MDRRDLNLAWAESFDEKTMTATTYGGETFLCEWEVCGTCEGRGKHVNPSIDAHGLTREDFDEDPDFAESYFRGDYDMPCNECHGRRVVPVPTSEEGKNYVHEWYRDAAADAYTRRMESGGRDW